MCTKIPFQDTLENLIRSCSCIWAMSAIRAAFVSVLPTGNDADTLNSVRRDISSDTERVSVRWEGDGMLGGGRIAEHSLRMRREELILVATMNVDVHYCELLSSCM